MVYMVVETGRRTVKIGFTSNLKQRQQNYDTHNSGARIIDAIDGDKATEKEWIQKLESMGWKRVRNQNGRKLEWFHIPKGVKKRDLEEVGFNFFSNC